MRHLRGRHVRLRRPVAVAGVRDVEVPLRGVLGEGHGEGGAQKPGRPLDEHLLLERSVDREDLDSVVELIGDENIVIAVNRDAGGNFKQASPAATGKSRAPTTPSSRLRKRIVLNGRRIVRLAWIRCRISGTITPMVPPI